MGRKKRWVRIIYRGEEKRREEKRITGIVSLELISGNCYI